MSQHTPQRRSVTQRGNSPFDVEHMEPRRLLAAIVTGELTVTGTKANDTIVVRLSATDPTMLEVDDNGVVTPFAAENMRSLRIFGLEGRDTITIDDANGVVDIEAFLGGGHGNDTLTGGAGDSTLNGGNGDDVINGGGGDDELEGGRGDDNLTGGEGEDVFPSNDLPSEITDNTPGDDGVEVPPEAAPLPVQDRINRILANEPGTELTGLFREVDEEGTTRFEAEFNQRRFERSLQIRPDGTVEEDETEVEISQLPAHVRRTIRTTHGDGVITEAERRLFAKRVFYEVEVDVGGVIHEMLLTERGRLVEDVVEE
jgi:hypothetical protein